MQLEWPAKLNENDLSHMGPVVVILYSVKADKKEVKEIVEYTLPGDTGHFSFLVTEGTYYLAAFEALNNNFAYDQEGLSGYYGAPDKIVVSADQMALSEFGVLNKQVHLLSSL